MRAPMADIKFTLFEVDVEVLPPRFRKEMERVGVSVARPWQTRARTYDEAARQIADCVRIVSKETLVPDTLAVRRATPAPKRPPTVWNLARTPAGAKEPAHVD